MSSNVRLESGRMIFLQELHQISIYEGVLEGHPTHDDNQRFIAEALATAASRFGLPVELIPPVEQPVVDAVPSARRQPARIPRIACAARFMSFECARDPSKDASTLAVLWFQEEFGLPGAAPFDHVQKLDWNTKATDFIW
jgi:hypothetical protein